MIIERLDLIAFGRFDHESIDLSAGPVRLHLVYGPNESGKSTSLRAIHSLLFGMPHRCDDDFLHGYKKMRVGGRLRDTVTGQVVDCVRKRGKQKTLLTPDEKAEVDPALIAAMLPGIDASTFTQQFGLTHQELVAGGRAIVNGGGDVGEMLFAAGAGAAALRSVKEQLEKDRAELFVSRGTSRSLNKLIIQHQELSKELRNLRLLPSAYDAKHRQREQAAADADALGQRFKQQSLSLQRMKAYAKALPLVCERASLLERLGEMPGDTPLLDEAFSERRRDLEAERLIAEQQLRGHVGQLDELRCRRDQIDIDDAWLHAAPQIKSLMNELGQIESDAKQLEEHQTCIDDANRRIHESIERISRSPGCAADAVDDLGSDSDSEEDLEACDAMPLFGEASSFTATTRRAKRPIKARAAGQEVSLDQRLDRLTLSDPLRAEIEKLAAQSGGLLERLEAAGETAASLQRAAADIAAELAEFSQPPDPAPLGAALTAMGAGPHALLQSVSKASDDVKKSQRRVRAALNKLHGFAGDLEQARALQLPPAALIAERASGLDQAQETLRRAVADLAAEVKRLDEAQSRLRGDRSDIEVPTAAELEVARCQRDRELDQLRRCAASGEAVAAAVVQSLSEAVRRVDRITDQMHLAHDQVVRRKRLAEDIADARQQVAHAQSVQGDAQEQLEAATGRWAALWSATGVTAGEPAAMRQWCSDHAALLDQAADLEEKCEALAIAGDDLKRHREHLLAALRTTAADDAQGASMADPSDLLALHLLATRRRDELTARRLRFAELQKNQQRICGELTAAQDNLARYGQRLQRWQARWTELTAPLADAQQVHPEGINAIVRTVDECHSLRRQRDAASEKIARTRRRREEYLARARAIAGPLAVMVTAEHYGSAIRQLARTAEEQEKRAAERSLLCDQIKSREADIAAATGAKQLADAKLQRLCAEAGCESVEQLPAVEQASARRRQFENELQGIDRQLRVLAESAALDDFVRQASQRPSEALKLEIEQAEVALEKLKEDWGQQQRRLGQLEQEVAAMDGSDRAAIVQQQQQNLLAAIRRQANEYAKLTIAEDALRRAIDHYREHNEGPVLARASALFSRLTGGEYASLRVDFDESEQPRLYGVRPDGDTKVVAGLMSDGTADALYLALRLASLEVHLDTHQPIPLIFDDCLIQFDDVRAAAALRILSQLARRTQVILFTHHQHLVDLANEHLPRDGFHLHQLQKPSCSIA